MKTILVTGANRGLGLEFCRQYAADGFDVIAASRAPDAVNITGVTSLALDVTDALSVQAFAAALNGRPIDMLINNAGVNVKKAQTLENMDYEDWAMTFAVNSMAPLRMVQALLPNIEKGQGKQIITISSRMGSIGALESGGSIAYRTSKAAVNMLNRILSIELKPRGISCVVFHPGWVQTDMGGAAAPVTPAKSIAGMRKVIAGLKSADNGSFFDFEGNRLPW